ncbi:MAG: hypothetical protein II980_03930, partial [Clostridia bacterium]|nr:hypothetical protein [Clostridia bacterium]
MLEKNVARLECANSENKQYALKPASVERVSGQKAKSESVKAPLLEVRSLRKTFPIKKNLFGKVQKELVAVDDVSFVLNQ